MRTALVAFAFLLLSGSSYGQNPELPVKPSPSKAWRALAAFNFTATMMDVGATINDKNNWGEYFYERNPMAQPIVHLPNAAFATVFAVDSVGVSMIGLKLQRSERFHRIWWLPQLLDAGSHLWGFEVSTSLGSRQTVPREPPGKSHRVRP
jgi:hypothetical protein